MRTGLPVTMVTPAVLSLSALGSFSCLWMTLLSLSFEMPWLLRILLTSPVRYVLTSPVWELTLSFLQEAEYAEIPSSEALPVTTLVKAEVLDCLVGQLDLKPEVQFLLFWLNLLCGCCFSGEQQRGSSCSFCSGTTPGFWALWLRV